VRTDLEIKRIDLWSLFKIAFLLYACLGLFFGLLYGAFMILAGVVQSTLSDELGDIPGLGFFGGLLGLVLIPVIAMIYGAVGSVFVTIAGLLYNLMAKIGGGLRFKTSIEAAPDPTADTAGDTPPTI
jgi:hypothetical protein